jgi:hypothetical protein
MAKKDNDAAATAAFAPTPDPEPEETALYTLLPGEEVHAKYGGEVSLKGRVFVRGGDRAEMELTPTERDDLRAAHWSVQVSRKKHDD